MNISTPSATIGAASPSGIARLICGIWLECALIKVAKLSLEFRISLEQLLDLFICNEGFKRDLRQVLSLILDLFFVSKVIMCGFRSQLLLCAVGFVSLRAL